MITTLDQHLRLHQEALNLRAQRQQLLASNIANADTPNYKARDIDFAAALKSALSPQMSAEGGLVKTSPQHFDASSATAGGARNALYRTVSQASVDGNTVDMDVERARFADNALRYEASLTFINSKIKNLLAAIQG